MTLDEAIKHCEEVAYQNEILMKRYDDASGYNRSHNEKIRTDGAKGCEQLISLYRQIAEWLRKLKAYESDDEICKCCTHTHNADYCNVCKHNTIFVDYFDLEVTADEANN